MLNNLPSLPEPARTLGWWERRRVAKADRHATVARRRVIDRVTRLGLDWRLLDARPFRPLESVDFLLFGPGGIFTLQVKFQGRARVMLGGEVIQIDGKRPPYVQSARQGATLASEILTRVTRCSIPVTPVIVFVGSGQLSMHGLPKGCLMAHYRELERVLASRGSFLSARTVDALYEVATRPLTWLSGVPVRVM
jgi:hypothetical protein